MLVCYILTYSVIWLLYVKMQICIQVDMELINVANRLRILCGFVDIWFTCKVYTGCNQLVFN